MLNMQTGRVAQLGKRALLEADFFLRLISKRRASGRFFFDLGYWPSLFIRSTVF